MADPLPGAVPPSAGKTFAISASTTGAATTVLLYLCHHYGVNDLTEEVAAAMVTLVMNLAGLAMHLQQRKNERKLQDGQEQQIAGAAGAGP